MQDLSNDSVVHIKKNGIEYIQFRKLLEYPEIQHCYTLKVGDLNFRSAEHGNKNIQENNRRICKSLLLDENTIVKPHQTHTDTIECVEECEQVFEETDGLITNKKGIILCTNSADCTNMIFYDPVKKVIANVHSGWRGTLKRIGPKAVKKMIERYGCNLSDIICCICPHIRKCHFEVENDVKELFKKEFSKYMSSNQIIEKGKEVNGIQKYYIDTTLINKLALQEVGLLDINIFDSGICTVCESNKFHSYRVEKEKAGRNAAMITLKKE